MIVSDARSRPGYFPDCERVETRARQKLQTAPHVPSLARATGRSVSNAWPEDTQPMSSKLWLLRIANPRWGSRFPKSRPELDVYIIARAMSLSVPITLSAIELDW